MIKLSDKLEQPMARVEQISIHNNCASSRNGRRVLKRNEVTFVITAVRLCLADCSDHVDDDDDRESVDLYLPRLRSRTPPMPHGRRLDAKTNVDV